MRGASSIIELDMWEVQIILSSVPKLDKPLNHQTTIDYSGFRPNPLNWASHRYLVHLKILSHFPSTHKSFMQESSATKKTKMITEGSKCVIVEMIHQPSNYLLGVASLKSLSSNWDHIATKYQNQRQRPVKCRGPLTWNRSYWRLPLSITC